MLKLITEIRQWKKDNNWKNIEIAKLEALAKQFDDKNQIEWSKLKMQKDKSNLEKAKLKIEIERLKDEKLFLTSQGHSFKISEINLIAPFTDAKNIKKYRIHLKSALYPVLNEQEFQELKQKIIKTDIHN